MTVHAPSSLAPAPADPEALAALEAGLKTDLTYLCMPRADWTVPRTAPDGGKMLDVLVIGAGQYGTGIGAALKLSGISNALVIDRAPAGVEGPWVTYARMPTLRSPKHHPGICFGIPRLTFQAWYRAAYGDAAWDALYKIPNKDWQDYILWVREVLSVPVRNGVEAVDMIPAEDHVAVPLASGEVLYAKQVVVATGRGATGGWAPVPGVSPELGPDLIAHTMHEIDFTRLRGKRVAMVGVGSSAFDNAATALEQGAASVDMYARRKVLPQLNKGRPSSGLGFLDGWAALPDAERWRLGYYLDQMQGVPPHETVLRTLANPGLSVHFETRFVSAEPVDSKVRITVENGPSDDYDFLILGTGFRVDLSHEPLFASIYPRMTLWQDAYVPPPGLERPSLGLQPYIGRDFELIAKEGPTLDRIHLFNAATWLSSGSLALDVPSLDIAPERLTTSLTRKLFNDDFEPLFANLQAWEAEHELKTTPFYAPDYVNKTGR